MQINWNDDEARMFWYRSNIDPTEKSVMLAICREYVVELYPNAAPVYRSEKGELTRMAIGIAKPILNRLDNYCAPSSQHAVQLLSHWYYWSETDKERQALSLWEAYLESYGIAKYKAGRLSPKYDLLTQHRISQEV